MDVEEDNISGITVQSENPGGDMNPQLSIADEWFLSSKQIYFSDIFKLLF